MDAVLVSSPKHAVLQCQYAGLPADMGTLEDFLWSETPPLRSGHTLQSCEGTWVSQRRLLHGEAGVPCELEGLEHLLQCEVLAVPEDDHLPRLLAQLALDEAQQVLLVHARAVVHVRVHLHQSMRQPHSRAQAQGSRLVGAAFAGLAASGTTNKAAAAQLNSPWKSTYNQAWFLSS